MHKIIRISILKQFSYCSIRFRNYTPKDDSLKEKVSNVVINEKPLNYEDDLKAAAEMPSV